MLSLKNHEATTTVTVARKANWFTEYGIRHVAIIPDGNRRWAEQRGVPTLFGHSRGLLEVMPKLLEQLSNAGVHTVTVWGFSTENWNRQQSEINHLMSIFADFLERQALKLAKRHQARVYHLGRRDRLFPRVVKAIEAIETATEAYTERVWNMALDYGGEDELARAGERMLEAQRQGTPASELRISDFLDTRGQPHPQPDVLVRSSGEKRMSGFLPLQTTYSELFFVEDLFPDFTFELMQDLAEQFRMRKRRFGA